MSEVDLLLLGDDHPEPAPVRALEVVRRGIRRTPGIKRSIAFSGAISVLAAAGRLAVPVLVQQVIDRGLLGPDGYRPGFVLSLSAVAMGVVTTVAVLAPLAETSMVKAAQQSLYELRRDVFSHIHKLSLAQQGREPKGVLLARVTSDVETISRFFEWGAITWSMNIFVIIGAFVVMAVYSWQLAALALGTMLTVIPVVRWLQLRQLLAYRKRRTAVGRLLTVFNEVISGSDTIRSYGYRDAADARIREAVHDRYRADLRTSKYMATLFTVGDLVAAVTLVVVSLAAVQWGQDWGLGAGSVVSFFFLVALVQAPIGELTEVLDQTQTAVAGWEKVLTLLDVEPELSDPSDPAVVEDGALSIETSALVVGYDEVPILHGIDLQIPAGTRVAVVGETGSGKTTLARALCRLLDPMSGSLKLGGVELSAMSADDRHRLVRLVPQDGFLFDTTVGNNITYGRPGATRIDADKAVAELGLTDWVNQLPNALDTEVGPRGDQLSVGERQLVALARAQVASPGLLVLDEATSSVDPETEQALAAALDRVSRNRTVVSIAHRISTAEQADLVLVLDQGELIESGSHHDLVAQGGTYAALHASWRRATTGG